MPGCLLFTTCWGLLRFMFIESVMLSNHLILCHPLFLLPSIFPGSRSFPMSQLFTLGGQVLELQLQHQVPPKIIQGWFPLGLTGLILQSKELSRVFSTQFKSIHFSALSFLYSPILTFVHDYRKKHSFDNTDLCWQSDVSAF